MQRQRKLKLQNAFRRGVRGRRRKRREIKSFRILSGQEGDQGEGRKRLEIKEREGKKLQNAFRKCIRGRRRRGRGISKKGRAKRNYDARRGGRNLFEILLNQPEIRLYLPFSD